MSALMEETNDLFILEEGESQTHKAQDFKYTGFTNDGREFMIVCDGHGWGNIINEIRKIDFTQIMSNSENPIEDVKTILKAYEQSNSTRGDGSTITIMLVVNKPSPGIRIWWIGDSSCRVYENEIEIWRSVDHNSENYNE